MKLTKTSIVAGLALGAMATTAMAGGLDRSTYSPNILFEKGNYIEGSYATVKPSVTGEIDLPGFTAIDNINPDYNLMGFGAKFDITDRLAVAFQTYDEAGADIKYEGFNEFFFPLEVDLVARAYVGTAKFDVTENFSVFGGLRHVVARGEALNLLGPGATTAGTFEFNESHGTGYIAGIAYSKPEIALRISLSYESAIEIDHKTRVSNPALNFAGFGGRTTTSTIPEAWELYVQTGIAPGTLLFGSVRHTSWSDANIVVFNSGLNPAFAVTDFDDVITWKLGLGKQLTEKLAVSVSGTYEQPLDNPSTLQPTDGKLTLGVGAKYKLTENLEVSVGASHTWLGDNETALPVPPFPANADFEDNSAWAYGTKIALRF